MSDAVCWPWLAISGESKLKMAFSSSSEVAGALKLADIVGVDTGVGDVAEVGVVGNPEGDDGNRLSRGRDPLVLILVFPLLPLLGKATGSMADVADVLKYTFQMSLGNFEADAPRWQKL